MPNRRLLAPLLLGALASIAALARPAEAFSPYLVVPDPAVAEASPAYRYANLADDEALAELGRRKILFERVEGSVAPGVRAPVRLTGRLHGVNFHSALPPEQRVRSVYEILDARLALALDDFAAVLERHDVDEVVHFSLYRPNVAPGEQVPDEEPVAAQAAVPTVRPRASQVAQKPAPSPEKAPAVSKVAPPPKAPLSLGKGAIDAGKGSTASLPGRKQKGDPGAIAPKANTPAMAAPRAIVPNASASKVVAPNAIAPKASAPKVVAPSHGPVAHRDPAPPPSRQSWAPPGTRHPAGLAIDVGLLHKRDGRWLSVAGHFHGHLGDRSCGDGAPVPEDPDARELRAILCESSDAGVFTYMLTPNYNAAHFDHFHLEIKPGVRWFLVH